MYFSSFRVSNQWSETCSQFGRFQAQRFLLESFRSLPRYFRLVASNLFQHLVERRQPTIGESHFGMLFAVFFRPVLQGGAVASSVAFFLELHGSYHEGLSVGDISRGEGVGEDELSVWDNFQKTTLVAHGLSLRPFHGGVERTAWFDFIFTLGAVPRFGTEPGGDELGVGPVAIHFFRCSVDDAAKL